VGTPEQRLPPGPRLVTLVVIRDVIIMNSAAFAEKKGLI
jgi:hypothetical protein